jgi:hypothetical protein
MNTELPTVLQLDVAGNPQQWISYEISAYHYAKNNVAWDMGAAEFDLHGGTNAITGKQTILTINTIIAIKGRVSEKAMRHYNRVPLSNKTLFRRDQNLCAYCGHHFIKEKLTCDHVHPTSRGGKNAWTNVVAACAHCNKGKSNKTPEEGGMKLLFVPYAPNRSEWLILKNRNIIADQMNFLLKRVSKNSRLLQN